MNVNSDGFGGKTPLMQCLDNSQPDCAEMLIEAGADVNITRDGNVPTALFYADETGFAKLLLRSGARINVKNDQGQNALERRLSRKPRKVEEFSLVLFAAGETVHEVKNKLFSSKLNNHYIKVRNQGH